MPRIRHHGYYFLVAGLLAMPAALADEHVAPEAESAVLLQVDEAQISLIHNTFIAAPIAGVVASVDVSEGNQVDVGEPLLGLRADQAETELAAAQSAYEAARLESTNDVDQRYAQRTLQVRQRELTQSHEANQDYAGTVSETEIEKLKLEVDQSRLAIEQAEHKRSVATATAAEKQAVVQIAKTRLNRHTISATVSGMVTEITVQPGEWVEPGKPVVRIISLDPLRAECFIDGRRYGSELVGHVVRFYPTRVELDTAGVGAEPKAMVGHVEFVSPELHPVTGQVRLWATIPNPTHCIRSGMLGRLVVMSEKISEQNVEVSRARSRPTKKRLAQKPPM